MVNLTDKITGDSEVGESIGGGEFKETIVSRATAPGRASVGIIRVSGPESERISKTIIKETLVSRYAHYLPFYDENDTVIDKGLAIFFPGPHSFTGEDVLELHGHGGPVVMNMLVTAICSLGARLARPGEFSEQAFLNNKIDLSQAEAISDLINSSSEQAARSAVRSLEGVFSKKVHLLVEKITGLRVYVEAAIDFPEEEIDFLADGKVAGQLGEIINLLNTILEEACQGVILQEGMVVVIAGEPNAGKSSLLNILSGRDSAIVTDIAGTTRDVLREDINIDGMPLHVIDTAGLRNSENKVEVIGMERALKAISEADLLLLVVDSTCSQSQHPRDILPEIVNYLPPANKIIQVRNKVDLSGEPVGVSCEAEETVIRISAKSGQGIDLLKQHLKHCAGFSSTTENGFSARRRHLQALKDAQKHLKKGGEQLSDFGAGELLAEDLRLAQNALCEITGEFSSEDLLSEIFSGFCIGK